MAPSGRGRGKGRGVGSRRIGAATIRRPSQHPQVDSWTLRDHDSEEDSSNDSPQPPNMVQDTDLDNPQVDAQPQPNVNDVGKLP